MAKLKKRIRRKVAVRRHIKRNNNNQQTKTSEQRSRENEMLKVMLGRPQQIIPGQTEKNDNLLTQSLPSLRDFVIFVSKNTPAFS